MGTDWLPLTWRHWAIAFYKNGTSDGDGGFFSIWIFLMNVSGSMRSSRRSWMRVRTSGYLSGTELRAKFSSVCRKLRRYLSRSMGVVWGGGWAVVVAAAAAVVVVVVVVAGVGRLRVLEVEGGVWLERTCHVK